MSDFARAQGPTEGVHLDAPLPEGFPPLQTTSLVLLLGQLGKFSPAFGVRPDGGLIFTCLAAPNRPVVLEVEPDQVRTIADEAALTALFHGALANAVAIARAMPEGGERAVHRASGVGRGKTL